MAFAFALDNEVGGDGGDDDDDDPDESDRSPADVAKSFSFCDSPTLGAFTANEWWAIIVAESLDDDSNLR